MCGSSAPAAPDYTPIANAQIAASQSAAATEAQYLSQSASEFATSNAEQQSNYANSLAFSEQQAQQNTDLQNQQLAIEQNAQATTAAQTQQQLNAYQTAQSQANSIAQENENAYQSVAQSQIAAQQWGLQTAQQEYGQWKNDISPVLTQYSNQAQTYDTPATEQQNAGQAVAANAQQFSAARMGALQQLESYGVDPTSTRYAALDLGMRTGQAASAAATGTQAIQNTQQQGRQMEGSAIQLGQALPGFATSSAGLSVGAGSAASGTMGQEANTAQQVAQGNLAGAQGISQSGLSGIYADNAVLQGELGTGSANQNLLGSTSSWQQMGLQSLGMSDNMATSYGNQQLNALSGAAQTTNDQYQNQLSSFSANQQSGQGMGQALGMAGMMGAMMFMEGGGAVPATASPSSGGAIDDVPARLNVGEFVTPKDVVAWKGQEFFHKQIAKAREDMHGAMQESGAIPDVRQAVPQQPTFISQSGALPT